MPRDAAAWEKHLRDRGFALDGGDSSSPGRAPPAQVERGHLRAFFKAAALRWWRPYAFHLANERADPRDRAALSGCGIAPGLPDLWLMLPRDPSPFAVVELKPDRAATVAPEQEAWLMLLALCGCTVASVAVGWGQAFDMLDAYAGKRRASDPPPPCADGLAALAAAMVKRRAPSRPLAGGVGAGRRVARAGGGDPPSGETAHGDPR